MALKEHETQRRAIRPSCIVQGAGLLERPAPYIDQARALHYKQDVSCMACARVDMRNAS